MSNAEVPTAYLATLLGPGPILFLKWRPKFLLCSPCVHTEAFLRYYGPTPFLLSRAEVAKRRKTRCSVCGIDLLGETTKADRRREAQ